MTLHTTLMIIAIIILIVNIILTIIEAYHYYRLSFSQHSPSINPTSRPARLQKMSPGDELREDTVTIDGMRYNVRWILRSDKRKKEGIIYEETDSFKVIK